MDTPTDIETSPPKSGGAFFQKFIFCFYGCRTVSRPGGVLPRGLGVTTMMKIKNLKYFSEKSLFSIFPEQNPVCPKVQLCKKNLKIFGFFLYVTGDSVHVGAPSELETPKNEGTHP